MSELITTHPRTDMRWQLLATASAVALIGYIAAMPIAKAEESDRPTVWIELGGQLSRLENSQEAYAPSFVSLTPSEFTSPQKFEKPPRYGMDESAALVLQPKGSDWKFSASLRYGRANSDNHVRQQSYPTHITVAHKFHRSVGGVYHAFTNYYQIDPIAARFSDTVSRQSESHAIVDFQAGKDFGIGVFGHSESSTLNVGIRFAQFVSKSSNSLRANPDWHFKTLITSFHRTYDDYYGIHHTLHITNQTARQPYHSFAGVLGANRSFAGFGPSISWDSSVPVAGNLQDAALMFDWGVNAALLFGRQKNKTHHQTTARFHSSYADVGNLPITYQNHVTPDRARSHGVVVPNIGAFVGFSVKYPNAKVSFGFKADFFFGAMDGGIDVRRTEDVGFHGPYASVSIGLGG